MPDPGASIRVLPLGIPVEASGTSKRRLLAAIFFLAVGFSRGSSAQHVADNPVLSADDAFGLTLGTEAIGLYGASYVRGFS